jgi:hypothetical protein
VDFAHGISGPVDLKIGVDGNLYYLALGTGSVHRVEYVAPLVTITANGQNGLVVLGPNDPLTVSVGFTTGAGSNVDPGEVYLGVGSPFGTFWWNPVTGRFGPTATPAYSGSVGTFGPATLIDLPDASVLPSGGYWWLAIVDVDSNGVPNGTYLDAVLTVVP